MAQRNCCASWVLQVLGMLWIAAAGCSSVPVDDYHGTLIADPYRWLEDPDAKATRAWIASQNARTFAYLEAIPQRQQIHERLTVLWNYERYGLPVREGDRYFYTRNDGLQNQAVLYVADRLESAPRILLDPNTLSSDGTVALSGWVPSPDGRLLAYGTSAAGSDWQEWRVRDVKNGADLTDRLRWIKFSSASWTRDGQGFYYSRYDEPQAGTQLVGVNYYQKLYYHRVGTPQSVDALVYQDPAHKEWSFDGEVTEDGKYLVISVRQGTDPRRRIYYQLLEAAGAPVAKLLDNYDAAYTFVGNDKQVFWFHTDRAAPRGRLIAIDTAEPRATEPGVADGSLALQELIPEAQSTLEQVTVVGKTFVASYLQDARALVKVYGLDGDFIRELELPGIGTASGFVGKRSSAETFYSFVGFAQPASIFRFDVAEGRSTLFREPRLSFDPASLETTQVFFASRDGTKVPMFISHKKGLVLDGERPTLLYGYGGFNISLTPAFSTMALAWMEMGGVYAVPNLRGGGEYGEAWHLAGTKLRKQNVFDDFIGAAEWLIANKYTTPRRLAIHGRSNGGLLVGACMTQRPELFGATLPGVGVMDMLRFHKFTIGWAWVSDYGSANDAKEFRALHAYSPLHNLRAGTAYPPTLITTADHDDRVVPAHSFKFAAALQEAHAGPAPMLIRVDTKAGHGAGKPTSKLIEEASDQLAFLVKELGV